MSKLKQQLAGHRRVVLAALLVCALIGAFAANTPSEAATGRCGLEFHYFNNAAHTTLVGLRGWRPTSCGCGTYSWGTISAYSEIFDSFC
jgi:hypothetical protein